MVYTDWRGRADVLFDFDTAAFAFAATLRKTGISGPNTLHRIRDIIICTCVVLCVCVCVFNHSF